MGTRKHASCNSVASPNDGGGTQLHHTKNTPWYQRGGGDVLEKKKDPPLMDGVGLWLVICNNA